MIEMKSQLTNYLINTGKQENDTWLNLYDRYPFKGNLITKKQKIDSVRSIQRLINRNINSSLPAKQNKLNNNLPKVLIFDIETAPLKGYVFQLWKQNIGIHQLIGSGNYFMLTWSAKWLFDDNIMSGKLTPEEALAEDDYRIVKQMWDLLDEADVVIAHYAAGFDVPMLNARFLMHQLPPPSFYKTIDTKYHATKHFRFPSNKLDYLAQQFGIGSKIKTDFSLWQGCIEGKQESLDLMSEYNNMDVKILEDVYLIMRPYIKPHPNLSLFIADDISRCPSCCSPNITFDNKNTYNTQTGRYVTFRCNVCKTTGRSKTNILNKTKRNNTLISI